MASHDAPRANASNGNDKSNDDNEHTPVAKKLKSSPTDLVIRIGEEKYEYHCHSMVMAHCSGFIDAALASPMQESQTGVIDLPDVSPKVWNLMMQFINSPPTDEHLKKLPLKELLEVAEKFDQYEFTNGIAICEMHISNAYEAAKRTLDSAMDTRQELRRSSFLSLLINCALRCNQIQLKGAMPAILSFFRRALALPEEAGNHCGGLIFMKEQLQDLAPLIAENDLLGDNWTKDEIQCVLFPKHFLTTLLIEHENKLFGPFFKRGSMKGALTLELTLNGKRPLAIAEFTHGYAPRLEYIGRRTHTSRRDPVSWGNGIFRLKLLKKPNGSGNWVIAAPPIARENDENAQNNVWRALWYSPLSSNCINFPPMKPWIKCDDAAPDGCIRIVPQSHDRDEERMMEMEMEHEMGM